MNRKLKKSTKKFLRNKRLRRGLIKQKKQSQKIRRDREIKNERLKQTDVVDDDDIKKRRVKQHLSLLTEKSETLEYITAYNAREELRKLLSSQNYVSIPPLWKDEVIAEFSSSPSSSEDIPPLLKSLQDSSAPINEKISIIKTLVKYFQNIFGRKEIKESSSSLVEHFRVISDQSKEYNKEKENLLLMFRVFQSFFRKFNFFVSLTPSQVVNFFNEFRNLLPFLGRIDLAETQFFSKTLFQLVVEIIESKASDEVEMKKFQLLTEKIFNVIFIISSFFPYPHVLNSLKYCYLLSLSFQNIPILEKMFFRLSSIQMDVTSSQLFEILNWVKFQLQKSSNFLYICKSLVLVGNVLGGSQSSELEVIIQPFFSCVSSVLEGNYNVEKTAIFETSIRVMEVWGNSQIFLHFPILPYLTSEFRDYAKHDFLQGNNSNLAKKKKVHVVSKELENILSLIDRCIRCFWNSISFEEIVFLLVRELEKNTYDGIKPVQDILAKIKNRLGYVSKKRENVSFDVYSNKDISSFEWGLYNDAEKKKSKRKRNVEEDEEENIRISKKRKVE